MLPDGLEPMRQRCAAGLETNLATDWAIQALVLLQVLAFTKKKKNGLRFVHNVFFYES